VKWALTIDVAKCNGCNNCVLATKDEYVGNDFPGYCAPQPDLGHRWVDVLKKERGQAPMVDAAYLPVMCQHCENAACLTETTRDAVYRRPDGIVMFDPVKSKGRKDIVDTCPYGAIWWNEELQLPQKWFFDAHLLDQGYAAPRCVEACPTDAIELFKASDSEWTALIQKDGLEALAPEKLSRPRVLYKSLGAYTKCFIGGSVACANDGIVDCLEGAIARLVKAGSVIAEQTTDVFGEFKFDGLEPESGAYEIHIVHGQDQRTIHAQLGESIFVGEIEFGS
jgi:Fe-S-cluster-containing dehydrogenase component